MFDQPSVKRMSSPSFNRCRVKRWLKPIGPASVRKGIEIGEEATRLIENGARRYQQQRYRSIDQAWVNRREQRIMATLLADCHLTDGLLLDVPCGSGAWYHFQLLGLSEN